MFGAFVNRRAKGAGVFNPLALPESSISWVYLWDLNQSVTLSGSDVDAVASIAGVSGHDLGYFVGRPPYTSSWRNGQAAVTPAASKALDITNTNPVASGGPYSVAYVGQFPTLDGGGEAFRIPMQGMGSAPFTDVPLMAVRSSGTWRLQHYSPAGTAESNSNISSWSGLPFVALVTMAASSATRVDVWLHGLSKFSASGLNVSTPSGLGGSSGDGVRVGSGGTGGTGTSGVFNAPIALIGGGDGTFSAADRDYLLNGFANRYGIVTA